MQAVVKATRLNRLKPPLDLSPFPQSQVLTSLCFALSCHQCLLLKHQPLTNEFVDELLDLVMKGLAVY